MEQINEIRSALPAAAKDIKLNIQSVLNPDKLDAQQTWGVALTSAFFLKDAELTDAVLADAKAAGLSDEMIDDAKAAAAIMAMNTVYYRFRHMVANDAYANLPARLRMNRMAQPVTDKTTFELFSMACAALAGCEMCINAHEEALKKQGLGEDAIHDCIRIAATVNALSTSATLV
ncbi:MAG: carboxymuconolactone decarboxylase family protein [Planctomycetota bacterium]